MALALSNVSLCSVRPAAPRVHRNTAVVVRSGLKDAADSVADGFVKIFSKPTDNDVNWSGTANEFKGKISRHGAGKPFKDGFQAGGQKYVAKKEGEEEEAEQEGAATAVDYVGEAVQNLVAHNFTGDETEPPEGTGSAGWKGDIHDRKRDGFHARKV